MNKLFTIAVAGLVLTGCTSSMQLASHAWKKSGIGGKECTPGTLEGYEKTGNPYTISGITYYPLKSSAGYKQQGIASWYGRDFHAKLTANGECYNMFAMTAAHPTLPLPTWVKVTNLENNKAVILRVNDRGPFARGRLIDLSYRAAQALGTAEQGVAPVEVEALPGMPIGWRDDKIMYARGTQIVQRATPKSQAHSSSNYRLTANRTQPQQEKTTGGSFTHRISQRDDSVDLSAGKPIQVETTPQQTVPNIAYEDLPAGPDPKITEHKFEKTKIYIQVGAFSDHNNAQRQRALLAEREPNAFTADFEHAGRTLHRVRSGPYDSVEAADAALAKLVEAGFNTAVIVVEKNN